MMDFDRKSSNSDSKAQGRRDPLLELTRLFGGQPENDTSESEHNAVPREGAEFPSGEFPAFEVAYPSQGQADDYASYAAAQPQQDEDPGFLDNVAAPAYTGQPAEGDFQVDDDAEAYDLHSAASYQAADKAGLYDHRTADSLSYQEDEVDTRAYPDEHGWQNEPQLYEDAGIGPSAAVVNDAAGYEREPQWAPHSNWNSQPFTAPDDSGDEDGQWPRVDPAWHDAGAAGQPASGAYDDYQQSSLLPEESLPPDESGLYASAGDAPVFVKQDGHLPHESFVYGDSYSEDGGHQPVAASADDFALHQAGHNPEMESFEDGFLGTDMPQQTGFEASDYETAYGGPAAYDEQSYLYPGGEEADPQAVYGVYDVENTLNAAGDGMAAGYDPAPEMEEPADFYAAEAVQSETYFTQDGQRYHYSAQPADQGDTVYEQEFETPHAYAQPMAAQGSIAAEETDASGYRGDETSLGRATAYQDEVLGDDFALTDGADRISRHHLAPELASLDIDDTAIEETGPFDLPPVEYEPETARQPLDNALDQEFADIFDGAEQPDYAAAHNEPLPGYEEEEEFSAGAYAYQGNRHTLPPEELIDEENAEDSAVYDWASPAALAAMPPLDTGKSRGNSGRKMVYSLIALTAFLAIIAGIYVLFFSNDMNSGLPKIIHAEQGEIKVKPESSGQTISDSPEQAVYNRVEGQPTAAPEQEQLIDKSEVPVDIHKLDEQPPLATESGLDQSSVENLVMMAAARSVPIHVVPTVVVNPDRKIINVSSPDQRATVLKPGYSMSDKPAAAVVKAETAAAPAPDLKAANTALNSQQSPPTAIAPARINEIGEPGTAGAARKQMTDMHGADTASEITPPAVIPDKPKLPVQIATNATRQKEPVMQAKPAAENNNAVPDGFYMQISSQPTREAAHQSAEDAKQRFGNVIGDNNILVVPAVIPGRGTYYRVRVPTGSREEALRICEQYKQAGGSCFIGR